MSDKLVNNDTGGFNLHESPNNFSHNKHTNKLHISRKTMLLEVKIIKVFVHSF